MLSYPARFIVQQRLPHLKISHWTSTQVKQSFIIVRARNPFLFCIDTWRGFCMELIFPEFSGMQLHVNWGKFVLCWLWGLFKSCSLFWKITSLPEVLFITNRTHPGWSVSVTIHGDFFIYRCRQSDCFVMFSSTVLPEHLHIKTRISVLQNIFLLFLLCIKVRASYIFS